MSEAESSLASGGGGVNLQLAKLKEANNKYKSLLKMAKDRIHKQEDELEKMQAESKTLRGQIEAERLRSSSSGQTEEGTSKSTNKEESSGGLPKDTRCVDAEGEVVRVNQRIKVEADGSEIESDNSQRNNLQKDSRSNVSDGGDDMDRFEIWALLEYETRQSDPDAMLMNQSSSVRPSARWNSWKKFRSESELSDYIRRDTGEPISLPSYSLSPEQSMTLERESQQAVSHITEEFRRYRVRAEVLRKQSDAALRALHSSNVHTTQQKIEGEDWANTLQQAKSEHVQLVALKKELHEQESQWKSAYEILLAENNALKGSGAEALLASQWRHRYEAVCKEKEDMALKLEISNRQLADGTANSKYEKKYREMKESFRLYRKKAKEIFEQQQRGEMPRSAVGLGDTNGHGGGNLTSAINDRVGEDARFAYLKNLMVNYLTANDAVREQMEVAICTVLRFSREDLEKVEAAKNENESWLF